MKSQKYCRLIVIILCILTLLTGESINAAKVKTNGTVIKADPAQNAFMIRANENYTIGFRLSGKALHNNKIISPYSIMPGDSASVAFDAEEKVKDLDIKSEYRTGELLFINKNKMITAEGREINFSSDSLFFINNLPVSFDKITPGTRIYARINPLTKLAGRVDALDFTTNENPAVKVTAFEVLKNKKNTGGKNLSFQAGDTLDVKIAATAGYRAFLNLPGIASDIPLNEKSGIYSAGFEFSRENIRRGFITICFVKDNQRETRIYPHSFDVAVTPPAIEPVSPRINRTVKGAEILICARLSSEGSVINPGSTQVFLNGMPIESGKISNVDFVSVKLIKKLKPGQNRVTVKASDMAGNHTSKSWTFNHAE